MFLKAKCRYWKNREMHILKKWISVILTVEIKLCKLSLKACVDNDDLYVDTAGPQKWTIRNFSLFTLFSWKVWVFIEKQKSPDYTLFRADDWKQVYRWHGEFFADASIVGRDRFGLVVVGGVPILLVEFIEMWSKQTW